MITQCKKHIKLIHCTNQIGLGGGGIAVMNEYYYKYLNRSIFDPVFVATIENIKGDMNCSQIPYHYIGEENRFQMLMKIFSDADIVQFYGGLEPLVCEAAIRSQVPILIELLHTNEPGQIYN